MVMSITPAMVWINGLIFWITEANLATPNPSPIRTATIAKL